ncbi:nicotinate-nucleotide adenylyltransferase [Cereibacter sediminicola]|uniref:nicotinate-nucleotide adenylyltransferase n=1 Tax=Cereibacter sediminicola TaxID=2584941 RepID=UPI001642B067|nr:nicotinate-nucleotide adenylyltransferase [Cereibacter sediminicola]
MVSGRGLVEEVPVQGWPVARKGMVVGLLGGSFDPPHAGHVHISLEALKRFRLDRVWWLVSPGNPLKPRPPAPLPARMAEARRLMRHPRVVVTDIEARLGTRFTAETLAALRARYPGVRFVWLMGADNLAQFHRWDRWQGIMRTVPVGVLARPGAGLRSRTSPAARIHARARVEAADLAAARPPAWCFLNLPMVDLSSTAIRATGRWR